MKNRTPDHILTFLVESSLKKFPDDVRRAACLAHQLRLVMEPSLKNICRKNKFSLAERDKPLPLLHRFVMSALGFEGGGVSHRFVPISPSDQDLSKIIEAIVVKMSKHGIETIDTKNPPVFSNGSIAKIVNQANAELRSCSCPEWTCQTAPLSIPPFIHGKDYEVVNVGLVGPHWLVRMKTPAFLDDEGKAMHNCIGDGSRNHNDRDEDHLGNYDSMLKDPDIGLYSYRDSNGPLIDMTVKDGILTECEGRNKRRPLQKYEKVMARIVHGLGCKVAPEAASATRLIWQGDRNWNIFTLPDNFQIDGHLIYKNIKRPFRLPKGLHVKGTLAFEDCQGGILITEGLSAKQVRINRCKIPPIFAENTQIGLLSLDYIPEQIPTTASWDRVSYAPSIAEKAVFFTGPEFIELHRAKPSPPQPPLRQPCI